MSDIFNAQDFHKQRAKQIFNMYVRHDQQEFNKSEDENKQEEVNLEKSEGIESENSDTLIDESLDIEKSFDILNEPL